MALTNNALNPMLDALTALAGYVSLHTGNPSTNGANEVSGGSYARKAIAWSSASGGSASQSGTSVIDVPGSTTVTYVGLWSAASGGTFYGSASIPSETFGSAGTLTVQNSTISGS